MMEYKGYTARVEFDSDAEIFHGQVLSLRDVITFQGTSVDDLKKAFRESVDDYLAFCAERGEEPEKPYSGKFVVRLDPSVHRQIAIAASFAKVSINSWVGRVLEEASSATTVQPRHPPLRDQTKYMFYHVGDFPTSYLDVNAWMQSAASKPFLFGTNERLIQSRLTSTELDSMLPGSSKGLSNVS